MPEQRILNDTEWNEECREMEAERRRPPVCCCENGGKPWLLDGVLVTSHNCGCRLHATTPERWARRDALTPDF